MLHYNGYTAPRACALENSSCVILLNFNLQTKLVNVAESISNKLSYFTELERVGSRLSSSTLAVTSESFVATLARLDECISFIEKNVNVHVILYMCIYVISSYATLL